MMDSDREPKAPVPMIPEQLGSPEMQARIAKARARATASSGGGRGKTADELERLAREQRDVDART